jgi:tetratricopeptide (TPR) repeat protein
MTSRTLTRCLAVCSLTLLALPALADPRFIVRTEVTPSGDGATIAIELACSVEYVGHNPIERGNRLRIQLDVTTLCNGAPPSVASSREMFRPLHAEKARLLELDYDGAAGGARVLTLSFSEDVTFDVFHAGVSDRLSIHVFPMAPVAAPPTPSTERRAGVRVPQQPVPRPVYAINLSSSQRPHAASEMPDADRFPGLTVFETPVQLSSGAWYRLRLGYFDSLEAAEDVLPAIRERYPSAWIGAADRDVQHEVAAAPLARDAGRQQLPAAALATIGLDKVDTLMADARRALAAGELAAAIQIYTKVLRVPGHDRHAEAQEFLAVARERNDQKAHAKAEYERYLELYPNDAGADRVRQRLTAMLARERQLAADTPPGTVASAPARSQPDAWRVQTFLSQYYRRDANQLNEQDEIVSQSALYSNLNLDMRRRGARFDFSSRLSAGYRHDFLDEDQGNGDMLRVSYAYAELADNETRLRGRIGRQTRHNGGVLGRFDGLNVTYGLGEQIRLAGVYGKPVNSVSDGADSERDFYGISAHYGPVLGGVEVGTFFIQQNISGLRDREAIGAEFRYFGEDKSLWGLVDFDTSYSELSSAFLQGNWRFATRSTLHASIDRRHTPYLSMTSALIGQPVQTFAELRILLTEEEIRQLSLDRSPLSTSYTAGLSQSLAPRLQLNLNLNQTTIDSAPESGGVAATPASTYRYVAANLTASSLFREGDVLQVGLRASDSDSARVYTLMLDSRFPLGRSWRLNPRLRVDQREMTANAGSEWQLTPGIRIQYRPSQRLRVELEAGRQFAERESITSTLERDSYFVNLGYQVYF